VEKDGSLTDIKVLRDIGYGTGKEAIRVLTRTEMESRYSKWGRLEYYILPIQIQTAD
jgi:protein TonB